MTGFYQSATAMAKKGWHVFPAQGKKPLKQLEWRDAATIDPQTLTGWGKQNPHYNIAVVTGEPSGIIVIDLDDGPKKDGTRKTGSASWQQFCKINDLAIETFTVKTGGGYHLYFSHPEGVSIGNRGGFIKDVDVRGTGGYVIGPGSIHPDTKQPYTILHDVEPMEMPQALIDAVLKPKEFAEQPKSPNAPKVKSDTDHPYVQAALNSEALAVATAPAGARNSTLNNAALKLGHYVGSGYLSRYEVEDLLIQAAQQNGFDKSFTEREARKTIDSGLSKGIREPKANTVKEALSGPEMCVNIKVSRHKTFETLYPSAPMGRNKKYYCT